MSPRGQQAMGFGVPPLTRGVKWLGGATLAISVLAAVLGDTGERLKIIVAFTPARFWHGWVWQPLTYTFLNLDPIACCSRCFACGFSARRSSRCGGRGGSLPSTWSPARLEGLLTDWSVFFFVPVG